MQRLICLLLCLVLLPVMPVLAEEAAEGPMLTEIQEVIRPGKAYLLSFTLPHAMLCSLTLENEDGTVALPVVTDHAAVAGFNQLWWNGTCQGAPAPEGTYLLTLRCGADAVSTPVSVGPMAPYLTGIQAVKDPAAMTMTVDFYASVDGLLSVGVWAGDVWTLAESRQITAGMNTVTWNADGMKEGTYALTLTLTDASGFPSNEEHVAVSPADFGVTFATPTAEPTATPEPTLAPTETPAPAATPEESIVIDPAQAQPAEVIVIDLSAAQPAETPEPTAEPEPTPEPTPDIVFTPSYGSPYAFTEADAGSYWATPMDFTDEDAMWAMLSSPITVVDISMKKQTRVYAEPDEDSRTVGMVTGESQGVRVIETRDDGWSLIEFYSSTFHDNPIDAWNMLVQGYIRTELLIQKDMSQKKYHIVVDKLTQRLYLYGEGKLITTLLVSTGLSNETQPYNETRSGEFLYISPTGGFWSDNMFCPSALKFNDGDLLHEVPYVQRSEGGSKIYSATEPYLGQRASHGCIRVQRKRSPEGINMTWIWNNRKYLGRIVVWEDWQGRQMSYPADDTVLYYNPKGGSYYHRGESCYSAKSNITFAPFTYGELDTGDFADLDFCPYCAPVLRRSQIDAINEAHAFGGDHDPILTEARRKYLETIPAEELLPCETRYLVTTPAE